MKKHDEGYVLVYVTVVLILFSLIGSMILTSAMKNLNAQQAAITQMQDKYAAQGYIEQYLAEKDGEKDKELTDDEGNVVGRFQVEIKDTRYYFTVRYGSVVITCETDSNGNYKSYEVSPAQSQSTETGVSGT